MLLCFVWVAVLINVSHSGGSQAVILEMQMSLDIIWYLPLLDDVDIYKLTLPAV